MDIKYEIACREAGLSEEKTAEIRRFFDAEKKKLKRRKVAKEKCGYTFFSTESIIEFYKSGSLDSFDIPDCNTDVEEEAIVNVELERLRVYLDEFAEEDKEFLLECFSGDFNAITRISERTGIPRTTLSSRKSRLVKQLQKRFQVMD